MFKLYDSEGKFLLVLLNLSDVKIESDLASGDKKLSFSCEKKTGRKIQNEFYIKSNTDEFVVKSIRNATEKRCTINANLNLETLEGKPVVKFEVSEWTAQRCVEEILIDTGWTYEVDLPEKQRSFSIENTNAYRVLQKIREMYLCEIIFDTNRKKVILKERIGERKTVFWAEGINIKDVTEDRDSFNYYTGIMPIGADGLKITEVNHGSDILYNYQYTGKKKILIWEDSAYKDAEHLKEDAEYKLNEISKIKKTYAVKIIDLAKMNPKYSAMSYSVGDTITVLGLEEIKEDQRIVKLTEYPYEPEKNSCELSNAILSFEEMQKKLFAAAESINNVTNGNIVIGPKVRGMKASQIEDLEIYATEPLSNKEIENICK